MNAKFLLYYTYPYCSVFDINDSDYLGINNDGDIYIGTVDLDVYNTGKAAEGYTDEVINNEEDIDKFFKDICEVVYLSDKNKTISKEDFVNMVKSKYRDMVKFLEY